MDVQSDTRSQSVADVLALTSPRGADRSQRTIFTAPIGEQARPDARLPAHLRFLPADDRARLP
jgi:hypothetical protein